MTNPMNPENEGQKGGQHNPSGASQPGTPGRDKNRPASTSLGGSTPERFAQGSGTSASQGGEQGDLRNAIRELAQGLECLCGDIGKRDEDGAKRHAEQAKRMASSARGDGGSSSSERSNERSGSGRSSSPSSSDEPESRSV